MAIGEQIRRIRIFRQMTQKDLGMAVGFSENTADVRIAQYETMVRSPKRSTLQKIASALHVSTRVLYAPSGIDIDAIMHFLFSMEHVYAVTMHAMDGNNIAVSIHDPLLQQCISDWAFQKRALETGRIGEEDYCDWKQNYASSNE